jgi:hypothetical protein
MLTPPSGWFFYHPTMTSITAAFLILSGGVAFAQTEPAPSGTSTDLFIMFGSDFDRPGLVPRANYNIGIGHTFGFLKKDWFGDELTFAYTYENSGTHGFLHTGFGEHTESAGVMKNFPAPRDQACDRLYVAADGNHQLYRQRLRAEPARQQCVAGRDHSLQRPQFHLDSGKLQQGGHGAVVHDLEHRLHMELVN